MRTTTQQPLHTRPPGPDGKALFVVEPLPEPGAQQRPRWQRWLRVEAIPDIHAVYGFFETLAVRSQRLAVLKWPSTRYHLFWPAPLKRLAPLLNHLALVASLARAPRGAPVLVREFDNVAFLLIAAPFFWPVRRRVALNVNHNLAGISRRPFAAAALRLIARLGFRLLWLEGGAALPHVRPRFPRLEVATPPFPVVACSRCAVAPRAESPFTVGLVGYFRKDKGGIDAAVAVARELAALPDIRIAAGFWNDAQRRQFSARAPAAVATCSTYTTEEYHGFLGRCHALVILAEAGAYDYRHSGILMDCLAHRTLPICPAYPLLESVVLRPVPVGAVYGQEESLRTVVQRVFAQRERLWANFERHAAARTPAEVAEALEALLR